MAEFLQGRGSTIPLEQFKNAPNTPPRQRPNLGETIQEFGPVLERLYTLNGRLSALRDRMCGSQPDNTKTEGATLSPQCHMDTLFVTQTSIREILSLIEDKVQTLDSVL